MRDPLSRPGAAEKQPWQVKNDKRKWRFVSLARTTTPYSRFEIYFLRGGGLRQMLVTLLHDHEISTGK